MNARPDFDKEKSFVGITCKYEQCKVATCPWWVEQYGKCAIAVGPEKMALLFDGRKI